MNSQLPRHLQILAYEREAQAYLRSLPPEHFMEATPQATQRKITLESLDLLHLRCPDVHIFNELLLQYPLRGRRKPGQVVPDNVVIRTTDPIRAISSYNVPLEPAPPFWVLEYVSKGSQRKDYQDSFRKYERHLKVPYYLVFYPDTQDLTLFRHNKRRYVTVKPNQEGRYPIPELEVEIGLLDGWVRYWHRDELLLLPADLQRDLDEARRQIEEAKQRAEEQQRRADEQQQRADELQQRLAAAEQELARLRPRRGNGRSGQQGLP